MEISQRRSNSTEAERNSDGNINDVLRFSIVWNDIGSWDIGNLCFQPDGIEIVYSAKRDNSTTGELDVDVDVDRVPAERMPAVENITWTDRNSN